MAILEENPEAVIEVKSLLADALRQKGLAVQADAITDEQLYTQIVTNSDVRANITYFLRARGYLSEADLRAAASAGMGAAAQARPATALQQLPPGVSDMDFALRSARQETELDAADVPLSRPTGPARREERDSAPMAQNARNVTDQPDVLHQPAPYNLRSLRDLYTQVPDSAEHLRRFGSDVFRNPASKASSQGRFSFSGSTTADAAGYSDWARLCAGSGR